MYGGGIEIGVDQDSIHSGNSFVTRKEPNIIEEWPGWDLSQDDTDWMMIVWNLNNQHKMSE